MNTTLEDREVNSTSNPIMWTQRVPILGRNLVTKQLGIVFLLPFLVMPLLLIVMGYLVEGEPVFLPLGVYAAVGGFIGVLYLAVILLGYWNRYTMTVRLSEEGMEYQLGRGRGVSVGKATAIAGGLVGSPQAAGAGLLAASRESGGSRWQDIDRARIWTARRRVVLYSTLPVLEFFVPSDLFDEAVLLIKRHVPSVKQLP